MPVVSRPAVVLLLCAVAGCSDARRAIGDGLSLAADPAVGAHALPRALPTSAAAPASPPADAVRHEALRLPADFPDDVFVPAGYRVDSVTDSGALQVVGLQAPGRVSALFVAARRAMLAHGWTSTLARQDAGDTAMLSFEKDHRAAVLSFSRGAGAEGDVAMSVQLRRAR